jgi:prepilin-type processing-associated H-X9-DG protein
MSKSKFMNTKEKSTDAAARSGRADAQNRDAFTLVELVVVLVTMVLLAAMVLPALASTKPNSKLFQCMNNLKQLAVAWTMYADDNSDQLVNLSTYVSGGALTATPNGIPWRTDIANGELNVTLPTGVIANTAAAQKYLTQMGFKQPRPNIAGPLYAYAPNLDVIHCPADFRANLAFGAGYSWDSYAGATFLNGENRIDTRNLNKRMVITRPSAKFIWVEAADSRGENVGSWVMNNFGTAAANFSNALFADSPAAFHTAAANFNFCDGHVENHKWLNATTVAFANDMTTGKASGGATQTAANAGTNPDRTWIGSHYPGAQNP